MSAMSCRATRPAPRAIWSARGRRTGCPRCAATSAAHARGHGRPAITATIASTSAGSRAASGSCWARPASCSELSQTPPVPVSTEQQHPARRQRPGEEPEQPQRRLVRPVEIVEDDQQRTDGRRGPAGSAGPTRTAGTAHRGGGMAPFDVAGPAVASSSQRRLAELGHRQPARAQDLRPRPVRRGPSPSQQVAAQHECLGSCLVDQRPEHRGLADPGIAADHQELTGTGQERPRGRSRPLPAPLPARGDVRLRPPSHHRRSGTKLQDQVHRCVDAGPADSGEARPPRPGHAAAAHRPARPAAPMRWSSAARPHWACTRVSRRRRTFDRPG